MSIFNYLDVTFNLIDLNDRIYEPFTKPKNKIKYIDKDSNHPPSVISLIQRSIELRLFVMRCTICYHLYNLKNVKNTHGGVLILVFSSS